MLTVVRSPSARRFLLGYLTLNLFALAIGLTREVFLADGCIDERRSRISRAFPAYDFGCWFGEAKESRRAEVWRQACIASFEYFNNAVDEYGTGRVEKTCDTLYREKVLGDFRENLDE